MTIHKEDTATDVDAVQIWSVKELEEEFTQMLKAYHDKETEFNWEAREKSITRLRGLLRGNATEPPYLEVLIQCMKQMVDGIVKAVESLRTQLAVKALLLIEDMGLYIGKHLDNYTTDQILLCMMRCSSLTKKMVASASFKATNVFLKHTHFYPKVINMLSLSMNEKNSQIRLYAIGYTKTLLQTHAHRDHTRQVMDRTNGIIDHFENILTKGLNDPTPVVKEACREAFWIFWEYWRERGDHILKQLPSIAQKQLEKSKSAVKQPPMPTSSKSLHSHSPATSPRASSSLGRYQRDVIVSPSTSNTSNGSSSNHSIDHHNNQQIKRSMSPRSSSPHLRSYGSPPPSSISSHLQQQHYPPMPSSSTSPTPPSNLRKTRVPTLNRKKSAVGLITKRKQPNFMTLLNSDDVTMRADGLVHLSKKLAVFPYTPIVDLTSIHIDVPNAPPVDGEQLKSIVLSQWDENYEVLSSWDSVTGVMLKLLTFEEYIPKLILDAHVDESARRSEADIAKYGYANVGLVRAKLFLQCENVDLVDTLFTSLVQYGGFVTTKTTSFNSTNKKDITKLPANRRKLTKEFLEWMDELVTPLIGLNEDVDYSQKAYEGVPDEYTVHYAEKSMNTTSWFESDDNVRQCLAILLPLITTSTSGTMWHAPLVTFMKHIRLLNQRLFEMVTASYDDYSINKICRVLGIHIRIEPPVTVVSSIPPPPPELEEEEEEELQIEEPVENLSEVELEQPSIIDEPVYNQVVEEEEEEEEVEPIEEEPPVVVEQTPVVVQQPPVVVQQPVINHEESADMVTVADPVIYGNEDTAGMVTISESASYHNEEEEILVEPLNKLSLQERNHILDHDIPTAVYLKEKELPPLKQEHKIVEQATTPDYFSTTASLMNDQEKVSVAVKQEEKPLPAGPIENNMYQEYNNINGVDNLTESNLPDNIMYANHNDASILDIHTVSNASAPEPVQQQQQQQQQNNTSSLPCSIPNVEKYPVPIYVPFFAPEKVNFPNPVFQQNARTMVTSNGSTTTNGRNLKDKTVLLYALIDKLKIPASDHHNTFRKLIRLFKEVPIRRRWDQGGIEENGSETWSGAKGDAGNFVELVQSILYYLDNNHDDRYLTVALECIRQLAVTQAGLFRFYERKVDEKGMTLESQLMEKLLQIRSNVNPTICIAAEDALDAVLGTLNPPTAFEMLMAFIIHRLLILPSIDTTAEVRYHPVGSAFMYLGKWVKEMNDTFYIDEWLAKGGVNAFFKGINHPMINIRKSCVEAIVAFHEVIGDDIYLFLVDLREDQLNLLRHYVAKALKKKASLRNLRDNGQF